MGFLEQFEEYNFTGIGMVIKDIFPGLGIQGYSILRTETYIIGISSLILIVLFNLRMIYSLFKYREVPNAFK